MNENISISIVIPTRDRSNLVLRSVRSALAQTLEDIEVIVVIDGNDENTFSVISRLNDSRVRIIEQPENVGGAQARNMGVNAAKGRWIAFLDDDDEWLPQKLEIQLKIAAKSRFRYPIVACRIFVRTPTGEFILPRRLPFNGEHISDYLMTRRSFFHGEGLVQTSMLFMPRELLLKIPFTAGLRRHHETDLLLRAFAIEGVGLEFADEPLGVWYKEECRPSVSTTNDWKYSLEWISRKRCLVTPRAYSSFLFTCASALAAQEKDLKAIWILFQEARKNGKPDFVAYTLFAGMWLIPAALRRAIRTFFLKRRLS